MLEKTKLNIRNRQTFKQGESRWKLHLVHPEPEGEVNEEVEDDLGLGKEDDILVEDDDDNLLDREDEDETKTGGPESTNDIISENKNRYN